MSINRIDTVNILSSGEQIAVVGTPQGWFVVTPIPDARTDSLENVTILKRVADYDEALLWFRTEYGTAPRLPAE